MTVSGSGARAIAIAAISLAFANGATAKKFDITTYHYDNFRTGWNSEEKTLTPANVASAQFQLLETIPLDDQVDAQPLILTHQKIAGNGVHDVVYSRPKTTASMRSMPIAARFFARPISGRPCRAIRCPDNAPMADPISASIPRRSWIRPHTIYLIAYTYVNSTPNWYVHALDPSSLADTVTPVLVTAESRLPTGRPMCSVRMRHAIAPVSCWPMATSMPASQASAITTPICRGVGSRLAGKHADAAGRQ